MNYIYIYTVDPFSNVRVLCTQLADPNVCVIKLHKYFKVMYGFRVSDQGRIQDFFKEGVAQKIFDF